jgi:hypothetical protein
MNNPYTDWQRVFDEYFGLNMRDLNIVELGKGEGTLYLHKMFKSVVSVEYSRYPFKASWEDEHDGNQLPGHILETVLTHPRLAELDNILISSRGQTRPPELEIEAKKLYEAALWYGGDVLFIDHGCHNRGEVLELAKKGHWKYIVVHDTNFPYYGYNLSSPFHSTVYFNEGQGTVILKKANPVLTVVIPTIGRDTIRRTVDSLVNLNNPLWEAKVGYDAISPQKASDLAMGMSFDPRVKHIFLPEKAGGGANYGGGVRNKLIEEYTNTDWVCFVDDDDTFRPDYVDVFLKERTAHPDADVMMFRMSYDKEDKKVLPPLGLNRPVSCNVGISFAVRKKFLTDNNLKFVNGGLEDFGLLKAIEDAGGKFQFSESITYNIRF